MKCIFCDIVNNKVSSFKVWEDRDFLAFLDKTPINPGHILLIPKAHFESVYDLPYSLYIDLFHNAKKISGVLKEVTGAKRIGLAIEGFGVNHAHVHLVPANEGNELNPERAHSVSDEELREMQKILKDALETSNSLDR